MKKANQTTFQKWTNRKMIKTLSLIAALFLFAGVAYGQTTAISANVVDSDTITWANGSWSVSFVPNPNFSGQYQYQGAPFTPVLQKGVMDGSGNLSITLPSNNFITPSGTQWAFVICPNASAQCTTFTTPVTGSTLNFTALFANVKAPRFATSAGSFGYSNVEVTPTPLPGGFYYNVELLCQEVWSGTSFSCGTGGGGTATNLQGPGSINGTFNGNATLTGTLSCGTGCVISTSGGTINATTAISAQSLSAPSALPSGTTAVTQGCIDNSTLLATDAFVLGCSPGGGGSPAGNNGDVQIKNGAAFAAGGENDDGTNFNVSRGEHNIGPDPWNDVCLYGALCGATASSTTANTVGTTAITVASAASFKNGQGVTIQHAGAAPSITALGSITLAPSLNAGGIRTVAAGAGSTSSSYKVVAVDKNCGYLAATTAVSTTTGNVLGKQPVNITAMSRSGTTVTVATSAPHLFMVGAEVYIQYIVAGGTNSDRTFDGFFLVASVPDSTHFTFLGGYDTTVGATTSDTGGIAIGFTGNTLSWTSVPGAFKYAIYGRTTGGYNLIGQTLDHFWVDYGSPMNDNQTFPSCLPTTAPSSGANDNLTTTIVSGGSTTSLVLASAAGATVTGATIVSDDSPALIADCIVNGPTCYVPQAGIRLNSYTILPGQIKVLMNGPITTNDTLELGPATVVEGWRGASNLSFAWRGSGASISGSAYPQLSIAGSGVNITNMSIACPAQNGCLQMADYAANPIGNAAVTNFSMDYSTMNTSSGTGDYLGMNAIFQNDGFGFRFDKDTFGTGSPGTNAEGSIGNTPIPSIVFKNTLGVGGSPTGNFAFTRSWFVSRASVDQDYVSNSGGINYMIFQDIQTQNSFLPQAMITGPGSSAITGQLDVENVTGADFPTAFFANLGGTTGGAARFLQMTPVQGSNANTTGAQMIPMLVWNAGVGQNGNTTAGPAFTNQAVNVMGGGNIGFAMPPPAAPTVAISGASGPAANTYTYCTAAVDTGNRTSSVGACSSPITVNGSQGVLVTYGTPSPGQVATTVCRATGGAPVCATVGAGFQVTGTTFLDNGAFFPNQSANQVNTGAASTVINTNGSATFAQKIVANNFATTITGTSTAARAQSLADVSGTFCYTTSNCVNLLNGASYGYNTTGWQNCLAASESTHLLCDMRNSPSVTFPVQINFGDSANDFGGVLLPCGQTMGSTITGGGSAAFVVYPNFSVIGCGVFANGTVLQMATPSSPGSTVTNIFATSGQTGYYEFHGFVVRNNCANCIGTTTGNGLDLSGMVDGSSWGHLSVFDYHETNIMHLGVNCCSTNVDDIVLRGDSNTTCTPSCSTNGLLIDYTGTSVSNYAMNITQSSIGHVSTGGSLIVLNNSGGGAAGKVDVNLGLHFSEMTTGATGPCIDVSGNVLVHFAQIEGCATTGATIQVENTGIPSVSFDSLHIGGGGATSIAVKNLNTSLCASSPCNTLTDANGYRTYFTTYVTSTSSASPAALGNAQRGAFSIASGSASVQVNSTQVPDDASNITITFDSALGTRLGVTCNTTAQVPFISAITPGTSVTIGVPSNFSTNPGCFVISFK